MKVENFFTILRGFGGCIVPVLMISGFSRVFIFFLYVAFALTDIIDGLLSRRSKEKSLDGDIFDPLADKVLFIPTLITLLKLQDVPLIPSIVIVIREIVVLGLRISAERHSFHIPSSFSAKLKTFAENFAVGSYILRDEYFGISASFLGDVSLLVAFILAVVSGAQYISQYLKNIRSTTKV